MHAQRNFVFILFLFISFWLWQIWERDLNSQIYASNVSAQNSETNFSSEADDALSFITINTDLLSLKINLIGGDITTAKLLSYPEALNAKQPFKLLETRSDFIYQAQSGLTGKDGPDNASNDSRPRYYAEEKSFTLAPTQNELVVPLTFEKDGVKWKKIFTLKRGKYVINLDYVVINGSANPLEINLFGQLKQSVEVPNDRDTSSSFALQTYRGSAYSTSNVNYKKYSFKEIKEENLALSTTSGWIAMLQQYFATAWIPAAGSNNTFYSTNLGKDIVAVGFKSTPVTIAVGEEKNLRAALWVGPENQAEMAAAAPQLDLTVDYGWLWFIAQPLFKLLKFINQFIGNWGFAIILITFIVRGVMYPLTKAQYSSMAKMRLLQPKLLEMRERFGNDKQRLSQEMMNLYKREKVNPLGGCLPLLIQMPIFLALYYMLMNSVELRHAPFILWIKDLAAPDPYYILPFLMGLSMFFIQKLSPTTVTDPMQQKIMTFLPLLFTLFFLWFPAGLVLYYVVSNFVTILQQQLIYRGLEKRGLHQSNRK